LLASWCPKSTCGSPHLFSKQSLQNIRAEGGKIHISDLSPDTQEGLRCDVYDAIRAAGVLCFWYAVHVAGFHKHYLRLKGLVDEARSKSSSRIKFSGRDVNLKRHYLHVELFEGLYGNVIAFCHERGKTDLSIEVRVDNTDSSIVRKFDEVSRGLLDLSQRTTRRRGFEPATKNWYEVTIRTQLKNPQALGLVTNVHELKLNPVTMTDGFVLAADVLANSLAHLP
jgi:hypothetical protein